MTALELHNEQSKQEAKKRIEEYNKNPKLCLCCGKPIFAPYDKKLQETKRKKFCSKSCSAKYNNIGKIKNKNGVKIQNSLINSLTDQEIIDAFNNSNNLTEFSKQLGYKGKIHKDTKSINDRLENLNLNLDDIILHKPQISISTKGDLFERSENWQSARSQIQRYARQTYENSDKPKSCIVCGYDKHYEVAHIKSVSEFEDDALISDINDIDNLVALCPNHHWEYDNTDFDILKYIN